MKSDNDLFDGVGQYATVHHVAVQTTFGMMIAATTLFRKLGYTVDPDHKAEGSWGKAIFLVKDGSATIQLTDSVDCSPTIIGENHLAILVDDPFTAAMSIKEWTHFGGVLASIEEVPGGKYFVYAPGVITLPIELVPNPKACPTCHGKCTVRKGREGMGYDEKCPTCKGFGYELDI